MSTLKKIWNWFIGKKEVKEETYVTPLPPDLKSSQEIGKFIDKKREQENAHLKAKVLRLQSQLEDKEREKQRIKEEQEIKKQIEERIEEQKKLKKKRALKLKLVGVKTAPSFFLKSNKHYHNFIGAYLQETKDGDVLWYPLLKKGKKEVIFNSPARSFVEFFEKNLGIVSQIRGGKVDSNYDIDDQGEPMFIQPKYKKDGEEVEVIDLSDKQKLEYEKQLEHMKEYIGQLVHEIKQLKKKENEYIQELGMKEVEADVAKEDRDSWASRLATIAQKGATSNRQLADVLATIGDAEMSKILTQRASEQKSRKIREMQNEIEETNPERQKMQQRAMIQQDVNSKIAKIKKELRDAAKSEAKEATGEDDE